MINFKRTFYPIGQGAFYVETHYVDDKEFVVVYDCGTKTGKILKNRKKIFGVPPKKHVDILFISHFHEDHINLVGCLDPDVVVIPQLTADEIFVLSLYSKLSRVKFDANFEDKLGEMFPNAKIVKVSKHHDDDTPNYDRYINLTDIDGTTIKSGSNIALPINSQIISSNWNWIYIPFNFEIKTIDLINEFNLKKIDIQKLRSLDEQYLSSNRVRNLIRQCYERIGGCNDNSLILYSGGLGSYHCYHTIKFPKLCPIKRLQGSINCAGCIYFGDITLSDQRVNILDRYLANIKDCVYTIQVPHHGSKGSYNNNLFSKFDRIKYCVLSFGENNSYHHPSPFVVNDICSCGRMPILITENTRGYSQFCECSLSV